MTTLAWMWIYAGAALMVMELVTPGFILCFFGLAAATTGALLFAWGDKFTPTWQVASFSVFCILYLVGLRRMLKRIFVGGKMEAKTDLDSGFAGRSGKVTVAIDPPLSGRVLIGDAEWTAVADSPIAAGADVRVVAQENLTMKVESL